MMNDYYEDELQTRVDRKFKPLMRVIWSGFLSGVIWMVMIAGMVMGVISGELGAAIGLLSLLIPAAMGIVFAQEMIRVDMTEKEEKRLAELGMLEKRKHTEPERLRLSDDGELVDYADYYEDESQSYQSAR